MKLLYLVVDRPGASTQHDADLSERQRLGQELMPSGSEFSVHAIPFGPSHYHESSVGLELCVAGVLRAVQERQSAHDAVLLSCFVDPGLRAARTIATVPVVGPGQASIALAQTLANIFGVITILPSNVPDIEYLLGGLQLRHKCAGVEAIDLPATSVRSEPDVALGLAVHAGELLLRKGAEAVVLGCMAFGFAGLASELSRRLSVPVIDPLRAGIMCARTLAEMAVLPSARAHPPLDEPGELKRYLDGLAIAAV